MNPVKKIEWPEFQVCMRKPLRHAFRPKGRSSEEGWRLKRVTKSHLIVKEILILVGMYFASQKWPSSFFTGCVWIHKRFTITTPGCLIPFGQVVAWTSISYVWRWIDQLRGEFRKRVLTERSPTSYFFVFISPFRWRYPWLENVSKSSGAMWQNWDLLTSRYGTWTGFSHVPSHDSKKCNCWLLKSQCSSISVGSVFMSKFQYSLRIPSIQGDSFSN